MLRVRDLDAMLDFYRGTLGMHEIRRIEFPEQRYSLVFLGYGASKNDAQLELWHEWDRTADFGSDAAYGHIGIGVRGIHEFCAALKRAGVAIRREPGAMRPGGRVIALIEDPEGHEVELLAHD